MEKIIDKTKIHTMEGGENTKDYEVKTGYDYIEIINLNMGFNEEIFIPDFEENRPFDLGYRRVEVVLHEETYPLNGFLEPNLNVVATIMERSTASTTDNNMLKYAYDFQLSGDGIMILKYGAYLNLSDETEVTNAGTRSRIKTIRFYK